MICSALEHASRYSRVLAGLAYVYLQWPMPPVAARDHSLDEKQQPDKRGSTVFLVRRPAFLVPYLLSADAIVHSTYSTIDI